jgi:pimeloyl-ACP methyl ester carboxylesterase
MTISQNYRPVVLVPGYWLGGWAWSGVTDGLEDRGVRPHPVTLPGLESLSTPRSGIRFADHVAAVQAAVEAAGEHVVLVAHSGAGAVVTSVLDSMTVPVSHIVYVDSGPSSNGMIPYPNLAEDVIELPLPPFPELEASGSSLGGLTDEDLARFRERAVPHPAGAIREALNLHNPARNAIPATLICCSILSEAVKNLADAGNPMFAALTELQSLTYLDLPTGHWPMWSAPDRLADILAEIAGGARA